MFGDGKANLSLTRSSGLRLPKSWRWLLLIIFIEAAVVLTIGLPLVMSEGPWGHFVWPGVVPDVVVLLTAPIVVYAATSLVRQQHRERSAASRTARLMDTVLSTSREWLWAVGPDGRFTFSGPACLELTGYEPSELLGRHIRLVLDSGDLTDALQPAPSSAGTSTKSDGLVTVCRHRNGCTVLVEVSGRPLTDERGRYGGFEGTIRALDAAAAQAFAAAETRARVEAMITDRTLLTAFQPIRDLASGSVLGAEALTRFLSSPGISPEVWFVEAASVGLDVELEILALETALEAAEGLPLHIYVAVNLSPRACLDRRLPKILENSPIPTRRIVLEVTEHHQVVDYATLAAALTPLRRSGLRIAVDDAGAGFASMRHILWLKPDFIKLDRDIIAGIDTDPGQRALGAAMVGFATEINAALVAEGIETAAELTSVTALGMATGQGYLLGRPSVKPEDWTLWAEKRPDQGWSQTTTRPTAAD